jgi:hypothetical protein
MKNVIQVAQEASAQGAPLSSHVFDLVVDDGKHSTGEGKKRRKGAIRLLTHLLILSIVGFVVLINALSLSLSLSLSLIYIQVSMWNTLVATWDYVRPSGLYMCVSGPFIF